MLVPAIYVSDWQSVIGLSQNHSGVYPAIGIHPWEAHNYDCETLKAALVQADTLLKNMPQLHIGEIGLDFDSHTPASRDWQIHVLQGFLSLAAQHKRLVSVHLRKAFATFSDLIKTYPSIKGFLHGFSGGTGWAKHFCSEGRFKVGVNGVACRTNARRYHQLIQQLPLTWLVLETDGPFVKLPDNAAFTCADIQSVAEQIAQLRNMSVDEVILQTGHNVNELLHDSS